MGSIIIIATITNTIDGMFPLFNILKGVGKH